MLDEALHSLVDVQMVFIDFAFAEGHSDKDSEWTWHPPTRYIFFTSGSTGEPKGAMCEHSGMLNHIFAKIDDLGIGEGRVAQTDPVL